MLLIDYLNCYQFQIKKKMKKRSNNYKVKLIVKKKNMEKMQVKISNIKKKKTKMKSYRFNYCIQIRLKNDLKLLHSK